MENYIVINGKKVELTEEQLEQLGIKVKDDELFERVGKDEYYYYITSRGKVASDRDECSGYDSNRHKIANYCVDEEVMKQRALHETLDRLLWRFSYESGELWNRWDGNEKHFFIYQDYGKIFAIDYHCVAKMNQIYFSSREIAKEAINKIIEPFMKEHPDFIW